MKISKLLASLLLVISTSVLAQQEALEVLYGKQTKMDLPESYKDKDPQLIEAYNKAMEEVLEFKLTLSGDLSEYKAIPKIDNSQKDMEGGVSYRVSFGNPSEKVFLDFKNLEKIRTFSANGGFNTIISELTPKDWQLTRESKEIFGIKVRKAIFNDEENKTQEIAWYAPKLPYKAGPDDIWGLPGLVLEYKKISKIKDDRKRTVHIFAKQMLPLDASEVKIKRPDTKDAVTPDEFEQQQKEYFEKMKEMYSKGVDTSD